MLAVIHVDFVMVSGEIGTWFGYNLHAELHCAICLYSLIEEAVIRVQLK